MSTNKKLYEVSSLFRGSVVERPDRFVLEIDDPLRGRIRCHLHDSGRLPQLAVRGRTVYYRMKPRRLSRKTSCDVVAFEYNNVIVLGDSRFPNMFFEKIISDLYGGDAEYKREVSILGSRVDFIISTSSGIRLVEVKGCTLVEDGICLFPDAPSERAVRHVETLYRISKSVGIVGEIVFMAMRSDAMIVMPNTRIHRVFSQKLCSYIDTIEVSAHRVVGVIVGGREDYTLEVFYGGSLPFRCPSS